MKCPLCTMGTGMKHSYGCPLNPETPVKKEPMKEIEELLKKLDTEIYYSATDPIGDRKPLIAYYKDEIMKRFADLEQRLKELTFPFCEQCVHNNECDQICDHTGFDKRTTKRCDYLQEKPLE